MSANESGRAASAGQGAAAGGAGAGIPSPSASAHAVTPADLERWQALADDATNGPWFRLEAPWLAPGVATQVLAGSDDPHVGVMVCDFTAVDEDDDRDETLNGWCDAAFIAASRDAVPRLVARVRELETDVAETRKSRDYIGEQADRAFVGRQKMAVERDAARERVRLLEGLVRELIAKFEMVAEFHLDLEGAPDGAVTAWESAELLLIRAREALAP